jgi:hypothetical protein
VTGHSLKIFKWVEEEELLFGDGS